MGTAWGQIAASFSVPRTATSLRCHWYSVLNNDVEEEPDQDDFEVERILDKREGSAGAEDKGHEHQGKELP